MSNVLWSVWIVYLFINIYVRSLLTLFSVYIIHILYILYSFTWKWYQDDLESLWFENIKVFFFNLFMLNMTLYICDWIHPICVTCFRIKLHFVSKLLLLKCGISKNKSNIITENQPERIFQTSLCIIYHFGLAFSLHGKPFIWKCDLPTSLFSCKSNSFSYERCCMRNYLETQAQCSMEMAHCAKCKCYWNNHSFTGDSCVFGGMRKVNFRNKLVFIHTPDEFLFGKFLYRYLKELCFFLKAAISHCLPKKINGSNNFLNDKICTNL